MSRDLDFGAVQKTARKTYGLEIPVDLLDKLEQELAECKLEEDRLIFFERCFPWQNPCESDCCTNYCLKKIDKSSEHREAGNEKYKKKFHLAALQDYNRAVAFAPLDHETLGRAYANRSAVLMALNEPEEAIVDIERALRSKCPAEKHEKLLRRRSRCEILIQKKQESEIARLNHSHDADIERKRKTDRLQAKNFYKKTLFPTKSSRSSELKTFVGQMVELKERDGEICLVMKAEAPAGTVLLIDKPYITVLNDHLDSKGGNCDYCLKKILGGIPCNNCVISLYCDESCRDKAQEEFHGGFECSCMNYVGWVKASAELKPIVQVIIRLISKLGPQNLYQLFQDSDEKSGRPSASQPTALSDYLKIYKILKPSESIRPSAHLGHLIQARILVSVLDRRTSFFEAVEDPERKTAFKKFLATFIIRHLESPQVALPLQQASKAKGSTRDRGCHRGQDFSDEMLKMMAKFIECLDFASGVYPVASNLGHSCEPNVVVQPAATGGAVAVVGARLLKKGEVLRVNFGWHFLYASRDERQRILKELIYIECNCLACRQDWPEMTVLINENPKFCCPRCSPHFSYTQKGRRGFDECVISHPHFRCPKCKMSYSGEKFARQLEMIEKKSSLLMSFIVEERPFAVLNDVLDALKLHNQNHICPPFFKTMWHQEMFRGALAHAVRLYQL